MSSLELATKMAQEAGFDIAVFEKEWNGYEVFYGEYSDDIRRCLGLPYYMLVKDGKIHLSTADEKCGICGLTPMPTDYTDSFEELAKEYGITLD